MTRPVHGVVAMLEIPVGLDEEEVLRDYARLVCKKESG
jgi:hypothetical protein